MGASNLRMWRESRLRNSSLVARGRKKRATDNGPQTRTKVWGCGQQQLCALLPTSRQAGTPPPTPHRPQCSLTPRMTRHNPSRQAARAFDRGGSSSNSSRRRVVARSLRPIPRTHVKQQRHQATPKPWRSRRRRAARCPLPLTWATSRHGSGAFFWGGFGVVHDEPITHLNTPHAR